MNDNANNLNEVDDVLKQYLNDIEIEPSASLYNKVRKRRATPFWFYRNLRLLLTLVVLISTLSVYLSLTYPGFHSDSSEQTAAMCENKLNGNDYATRNVNSYTEEVKSVNDENALTKNSINGDFNDGSVISAVMSEPVNDNNAIGVISHSELQLTLPDSLRQKRKKSKKKLTILVPEQSQPNAPDFIKEDHETSFIGHHQDSKVSHEIHFCNVKRINSIGPPLLTSFNSPRDPSYLESPLQPNQKSLIWLAEVSCDLTLNSFIVASNSHESESMASGLSEILTRGYSTQNWNLLAGFIYRNINIKAGVSYSAFSENFIHSDLPLKPSQQIQHEYNGTPWTYSINNAYFYVDSSNGYFHYSYIQDSATHVFDSVWVYLYDTSQVSIFDSVMVNVAEYMKYKRQEFTYSVFEFPLIYAYQYPLGRIGISFGGGIVPGIVTAKPRFMYNGSYFEPAEMTGSYNRFIISALCMAESNYWLNERTGIMLAAGYKRGLNSLYRDDRPYVVRTSAFFLRFGVQYRLK